jgi:hypothetical protein
VFCISSLVVSRTLLLQPATTKNKYKQVKRRMEEEEEKGLRARKRMSSPELWEARQLIASGAFGCALEMRWREGWIRWTALLDSLAFGFDLPFLSLLLLTHATNTNINHPGVLPVSERPDFDAESGGFLDVEETEEVWKKHHTHSPTHYIKINNNNKTHTLTHKLHQNHQNHQRQQQQQQ